MPDTNRPVAAELVKLFVAHLRAQGRAVTTVELYENTLGRIDRDLRQGLIGATEDELHAWIYRDRWSPSTRHTYLAAVRMFFGWACDPRRPRLPSNPAAWLPIPKVRPGVPRPVPDHQLRTIFAGVTGPVLLWCILAAYAGLRCCEIARLEREHVTEDEIFVTGKGDKERLVPTHEQIWVAVRDLPPGPLALRCDGTVATRQHISSKSTERFARLGLPGVTLHRLRHQFATTALAAPGSNLRVVQELLGHASPATTAIYTFVPSKQLAAVVRAIPVHYQLVPR